MNKTIDRYVYAVIRRLPEHKRVEIKKELEANIYDMLPNNPTEQQIDTVLHQLGHPMVVAHKYQEENVYVVNPVFYQDYKNILMLVMAGGALLGLLVALITSFTDPSINGEIGHLIGAIISQSLENIIGFAFAGFTIVTLIFWAFNTPKAKPKMDDYLKNWKTKDLNAVPRDTKKDPYKNRITIFIEAFFALLIQSILVAAVLFYLDKIGVYRDGVLIASLFSTSVKPMLLIVSVLGLLASAGYYVSYVLYGKKNLVVSIIKTIMELISIISMIVIFTYPNLFNNDFNVYMANIFNISVAQFNNYTTIALNTIMALVIFIAAIEVARNWITYRKNRNY